MHEFIARRIIGVREQRRRLILGRLRERVQATLDAWPQAPYENAIDEFDIPRVLAPKTGAITDEEGGVLATAIITAGTERIAVMAHPSALVNSWLALGLSDTGGRLTILDPSPALDDAPRPDREPNPSAHPRGSRIVRIAGLDDLPTCLGHEQPQGLVIDTRHLSAATIAAAQSLLPQLTRGAFVAFLADTADESVTSAIRGTESTLLRRRVTMPTMHHLTFVWRELRQSAITDLEALCARARHTNLATASSAFRTELRWLIRRTRL